MELTPYGDPSLYEGIALILFSPLIRKFKVYEWFKNLPFDLDPRSLDPRRTFANLTFYQWISASVLVAFSLIMVLFTDFTSANIVVLRVATGAIAGDNINLAGAGHWLVWVALFLVFVRYGFLDVAKGAVTMMMFGSLHEVFWYLAYLYINPMNAQSIVWYYSPFIIFTLGSLFAYAVLFRNTIPRRKMLITLAFFSLFYLLWVAIGFPITIDNVLGPTPLYYDLMTNLIEDLSWLAPAFLLIK